MISGESIIYQWMNLEWKGQDVYQKLGSTGMLERLAFKLFSATKLDEWGYLATFLKTISSTIHKGQ